MNKYNNSKIYTIRSHQTDKFYIGSTIEKYLSDRMVVHRSNYKRFILGLKNYISSFEILQFEDAYIELLENVKCNNKEELNKIEGQYIRQYKDQLVNIRIEGNKPNTKILCSYCDMLISNSNIKRHEKIKHKDII